MRTSESNCNLVHSGPERARERATDEMGRRKTDRKGEREREREKAGRGLQFLSLSLSFSHFNSVFFTVFKGLCTKVHHSAMLMMK